MTPPDGARTDLPPQPIPDPDSTPYWEATTQGRIALCRCVECRRWLHPPLERCRSCGGPTAFDEVSGAGTVHGFIVMHRASIPGQGPDPYAIVEVELDDAPGTRLTGRLDGEPGSVRVGDRVAAVVVPIPGGPHHQPAFRPA